MSTRTYELEPREGYALALREESTQTLAQSAMEHTFALAECDVFRDRLRAASAHQIMSNVATLSAAESYYTKLYPGGADEYRKIVETYTDLALINLRYAEW